MTDHVANTWDADLYDGKISYVSELGKGVVELLAPQPGERILDLGCGTGDLTFEIARRGAIPEGIDLSPEMIGKARQKYPDIQFDVGNGETFRTVEPYDAVFSNAALHWMTQPQAVVASVWHALRPGGRFVAEFGGKDNVETVIKGITEVLKTYGIDAAKRNPWYFPSIGEYSSLLEKQGFRVTYAIHFDRLTPVDDGEDGLQHWLHAFAQLFFYDFSEAERKRAFQQIEEKVRPVLHENGMWVIDYKRIRVVARKEG